MRTAAEQDVRTPTCTGADARQKYRRSSQLPWSIPVNNDSAIEPLDEDGLHAIHNAAMRVLEEIGIDFLHEEAKSILKLAGCDVVPGADTVRMDRDFVMEKVRLAPEQFTIMPRNPSRAVTIGGKHVVYSAMCPARPT